MPIYKKYPYKIVARSINIIIVYASNLYASLRNQAAMSENYEEDKSLCLQDTNQEVID